MRAVIQRVTRASVTVDSKVVGEIGQGLVVLAGCFTTDTDRDVMWMADKVANLRIFEDAAGKMNLGVKELDPSRNPGILMVPNFTVAGDAQKGRRPSFDRAMRPEQAGPMFDQLCAAVAAHDVRVATGVFRAQMLVELANDGPITIVVESPGGE